MVPERISVIGAGSWGTALAVLLCQNIKRVTLWGRDSDAMRNMAEHRHNSRYLPGVRLPDNLIIESEISAGVNEALNFVIAVPSVTFRNVLCSLKSEIISQGRQPSNATLIWGTKGFDPECGKLLSDVTNDVFGRSDRHGVISGPSFAKETAKLLPTALTLACPSKTESESIATWFRTETTRVYFSDDVIGVQLGGAIKNVMAIAAGISDGLGFGANARAALITRGLSELTRLGVTLGGRAETFMGLTGVGDLILTSTDDQSRNRRFGIGIGMGKAMSQVINEIGQEIEGINTVKELYGISQTHRVDMPITEQVFKIVHQGDDPASAVRRLLQRDPKSE